MNAHAPKIIIIDDEPSMTKLLKLILEQELSAKVETHNDPTEAYRRLQEETFDVISLDHRMPKMTGMSILKLLRTVKGPNASTPVVIFTGFREEAENLNINLLENVLFLEKPIEDERYLHHIKMSIAMKAKLSA